MTAYSVTITPATTSSRILIYGSFGLQSGGSGTTQGAFYQLQRSTDGGSTFPTTVGPNVPTSGYTDAAIGLNGANAINSVLSFTFLDSPATTNSCIYRIRILANGTNTVVTTGAGGQFTALEIAG